MKKIDLTGMQFGRLCVLQEVEKSKWNKIQYRCSCECGNTKTVLANQLRLGKTKSCGCLQKSRASEVNTKHGMHKTTEYRAWTTIVSKHETMQLEWKEFKNFLQDMGKRPSPKHMICKHDIHNGYSKENCYWGLSVKRIDISKYVGKTYGRLTIIGQSDNNKHNQPQFRCECTCGKIINKLTSKVISGETQSCGCYQRENARQRMSQTQEEFLIKAKAKHGTYYSYERIHYVNSKTPIVMRCPQHGDFSQTPVNHLQYGCAKCGIEASSKKKLSDTDTFIIQARTVHGDRYDYHLANYTHAKHNLQIICKTHGTFLQTPNSHLNGNGCKACGTLVSRTEKDIADFIESLETTVERSRRDLLPPTKKEADIFIPSKKIIIEYNGNYFHSAKMSTDKFNLQTKSELARNNGYRCIHIREDQWADNKPVVKALLRAALGIFTHRIGARRTTKKEINNVEYRKFCKHHLQGFRPALHKQGLYYQDELVACIGYNRDGELVRYVVKNDWQILGALPKLMKNESITYSFCDLAFFTGASYLKAGFKLAYNTVPNYRYVRNKKTVTRNVMMKHKLKNILNKFNPNLTEEQNCANNGWYKLYDCGNAKYICNAI